MPDSRVPHLRVPCRRILLADDHGLFLKAWATCLMRRLPGAGCCRDGLEVLELRARSIRCYPDGHPHARCDG